MYWHGEIPRESGEHHIIKELVLLLTHRAIRAGFARMLYYPLGEYCSRGKSPCRERFRRIAGLFPPVQETSSSPDKPLCAHCTTMHISIRFWRNVNHV